MDPNGTHLDGIPSFDVVDPDGERVTIHPHSADDRVSDLLCAIDAPRGFHLVIDGLAIASHRRLVEIPPLRMGSWLELGSEPPEASVPRASSSSSSSSRASEGVGASMWFAVTSGPACTSWIPLAAGRHGVGRAVGSTVPVADAEPHHGVFEVDTSGGVTFTQLTGRVPVRVRGEPTVPAQPIGDGDELEIGSSIVAVRSGVAVARPSGTIGAACGDRWRRVVDRAPAPDDVRVDPSLVVPSTAAQHPRPPATGLIGAGVGIGGAVAIATLLGQPMFALFALIGALASFATWIGGVVGARRRQRRANERARSESDRFAAAARAAGAAREAHHRHRHPTVSATLEVYDHPFEVGELSPLWNRRVDRADVLSAVIGDGDLSWDIVIEPGEGSVLPTDLQLAVERAGRLESVPVPISFAPGSSIALHGRLDQLVALTRSIIVQLATWTGPADWQLCVVTGDPDRWRWCEWLPHMAPSGGERTCVRAEEIDRLSTDDHREGDQRLLVVVDAASLLRSRTGTLRRYLTDRAAAALVLVDEADTVPSICRRVLTIGSGGVARWTGGSGTTDLRTTRIRTAGIDQPTADRVARSMSPLVDPEFHDGAHGELPADVRIADLDGAAAMEPSAIVARWRAGGHDPRPATPIGRTREGLVEVDLVRDGPHGLIAGTTGAGKSELLRTLVVGLASRLSPEHLTFVLVDYKGGSTFDACVDLPHTVGVVTDLDAGLAERALVSLEAELLRRERLLRDVAAGDLAEYRAREGTAPLPRLVVVVDEFAALAKELPLFLDKLVGVAQRGRSLGIHLLLATQRPAGVVSDDIRANTNLRLALRLHDTADALDVVGDDLPSKFPRHLPGRAALRLGPDELVVFQTARCTAPARRDAQRLRVERHHESPRRDASPDASNDISPDGPAELWMLVAAIAEAASRSGIAAPHRPWHDPLPRSIAPPDLSDLLPEPMVIDDAVGVIDDPEAQCRRPLRWRTEAGNLAVIGSLGSGTTSALLSIAVAQCRTMSSRRCHLYVIDAGGDPMFDHLADVAHCGGVIRVQEAERLARLLRRLVDEIDDRISGADGDRPRIVLLIDGLGALRSALSSLDDALQLAQLDRVLSEGAPVDVLTAFTIDGGSTAAAMTPAGERWLFALDDPATARSFGAGRPVASGTPGRMRIAASGLEAHVVDSAAAIPALATGSSGDGHSGGPSRIGTLPRTVLVGRLRPAGTIAAIAEGDTIDPAGAVDPDPPIRSLLIGLACDDLAPAVLSLPIGDHIFIAGLARTGRSYALARVAAAWVEAAPGGRVVSPTRDGDLPPDVVPEGAGSPLLVVVDDAERLDDRDGSMRDLLARPGVTIAIAARLDAVRSTYGHWTREVARSRCGLIMTAASEIDGDLLGVTLPRRSLVTARPGLGWLVDGSGHRLVQVALDERAPV
jgi:S-DNA-T family DNA segregation ATPase FtsK/SpoIIIE